MTGRNQRGNTLRARHGVPRVRDRRRVAAREGNNVSGLSIDVERRHGPLHRAQLRFDVEAHGRHFPGV